MVYSVSVYLDGVPLSTYVEVDLDRASVPGGFLDQVFRATNRIGELADDLEGLEPWQRDLRTQLDNDVEVDGWFIAVHSMHAGDLVTVNDPTTLDCVASWRCSYIGWDQLQP